MQSLGRALRAVRLAKGLSQEQVADGAGISRPYITNIENDHRDPSWSMVTNICASLGVPVSTITILAESNDNEKVRSMLPYAIIEML